MNHHDTLMTFAQVGATFAGFAAVIGAFRDNEDLGRTRWIIRDVVEISVIVTMFAFVPSLVHGIAPESSFWRISSGIVAIGGSIGWALSVRRNLELWSSTPGILIPVAVATIVVVVSSAVSAFHLAFSLPDMVYLFGLFAMLCMSGYMFVYLITDSGKSRRH